MRFDDVINLLRGKLGTDVTITVQRKFLEPFDVTLTRGKIRSAVSSQQCLRVILVIFGSLDLSAVDAKGHRRRISEALEAHKTAGMKALFWIYGQSRWLTERCVPHRRCFY